MKYTILKEKAHDLLLSAPFIGQIHSKKEYANALAFMDELIEDYDYNKPLIDILSNSIERWEEDASEFNEFNKRIAKLNSGVEMLKLIMDQYELGVDDFPEIGSKSLISKIIHKERTLTLDHIKALSKRFKIDPLLFI